METTPIDYPKLRPLEIRPVAQNGRRHYLLHDPLQLCDQTLLVPQPLHLVLPLCDGTRADARALAASLAVRYGIQIPPAAITQLLQALDQTCLLENETYFDACSRVLDEYREAAYPPSASAGLSYPAVPHHKSTK